MRLALLIVAGLALGAPAARALPNAAQIKVAFTALDVSGNGAISMDEWERGSFALFRAADKNNDNFIDPEELPGSGIAQDTFLRADTDRDGKLSVAEFMALRRAIFRIADIDRDESLSYAEYELLIVMEQVGWMDRNNNGRIELSELRESLEKGFDQLDSNHDKFLSETEAAYLRPAAFKKFDKNGDGRLDLEEYCGGYRAEMLGGY